MDVSSHWKEIIPELPVTNSLLRKGNELVSKDCCNTVSQIKWLKNNRYLFFHSSGDWYFKIRTDSFWKLWREICSMPLAIHWWLSTILSISWLVNVSLQSLPQSLYHLLCILSSSNDTSHWTNSVWFHLISYVITFPKTLFPNKVTLWSSAHLKNSDGNYYWQIDLLIT